MDLLEDNYIIKNKINEYFADVENIGVFKNNNEYEGDRYA